MTINATFIGQFIAFAILIWFSYKYVWPPLVNAIDERQKKIADGLAAADRARRELADADVRVADEIKKARVEATGIADRAQKQANELIDKAKQDAIAEGLRQKALADDEIAGLSLKAREALRAEVALLAVKGAEQILKREIDPARHRDLLEALAKEI